MVNNTVATKVDMVVTEVQAAVALTRIPEVKVALIPRDTRPPSADTSRAMVLAHSVINAHSPTVNKNSETSTM
jgi:hypothetical protein